MSLFSIANLLWKFLKLSFLGWKIKIVLGGGPELIDLLLDEFKQEIPFSVIFVRGSGGAADVVSYAHRSVSLYYYDNQIALSVIFDFLKKEKKKKNFKNGSLVVAVRLRFRFSYSFTELLCLLTIAYHYYLLSSSFSQCNISPLDFCSKPNWYF